MPILRIRYLLCPRRRVARRARKARTVREVRLWYLLGRAALSLPCGAVSGDTWHLGWSHREGKTCTAGWGARLPWMSAQRTAPLPRAQTTEVTAFPARSTCRRHVKADHGMASHYCRAHRSWLESSRTAGGMLSVENWAEVRRLHRCKRSPTTAIARALGIPRNTVHSALAAEVPPKSQYAKTGSILASFEPRARELLNAPSPIRRLSSANGSVGNTRPDSEQAGSRTAPGISAD